MAFKELAIASDHRGFWLKKDLIEYFKSQGYCIKDLGTDSDCMSVDYPDYAKKVCDYVNCHKESFGILVCHTGVGMSISANRFHGIRAVLCNTEDITKLSREHNDANVLCLGAGFIDTESAIKCAHIFAKTEFSDERHLTRIRKIDAV